MPESNNLKLLSIWDKILLFLVILLIILFSYCYYNINKLENEINKLESVDLNIHKTLSTVNIESSLNELNSNYKKNKEDIDKLNTIITSYVNASTQQMNVNTGTNNELNNIDFYTQLQMYISENNEKLDNFISETNDRLTELEDSKNVILDSINNINNKLE